MNTSTERELSIKGELLRRTALEVRRRFAWNLHEQSLQRFRYHKGDEWKKQAEQLLQNIERGDFGEFCESGYCGYVAPLLTKALHDKGMKCRTVYGRYLTEGFDTHHAWNRVGGLIVDATYHQFDPQTFIVILPASDPRYAARTRRTWAYSS